MSLRFIVFVILLIPSVASNSRRIRAVGFCANYIYEPSPTAQQMLIDWFYGYRITHFGRHENMIWWPDSAYKAKLCLVVPDPRCIPVYYNPQSPKGIIATEAAFQYQEQLERCNGYFGCACKEEDGIGTRPNFLVLTKKYFCGLSKVLRVAMDYKFPGITILHQKLDTSKNKNKVSQFLSGKHGKIPKNPPVSVGKVQQIPFGCIWGEKEASCIFITGKFIKFLRNFVDFVDVPLISIVSEDLEKLNNTELSSNNSKISSNSSLPNVLKKL